MEKLPNDIKCLILSKLDTVSMYRYVSLTKVLFGEFLDDAECIAHIKYGKTFWNQAQSRPIEDSRPYLNYYHELQRIGQLERKIGRELMISDFKGVWEYDRKE